MLDPCVDELPAHIQQTFVDTVDSAHEMADHGNPTEAGRRLQDFADAAEEAGDAGRPWGASLAAHYREALAELNASGEVAGHDAV